MSDIREERLCEVYAAPDAPPFSRDNYEFNYAGNVATKDPSQLIIIGLFLQSGDSYLQKLQNFVAHNLKLKPTFGTLS